MAVSRDVPRARFAAVVKRALRDARDRGMNDAAIAKATDNNWWSLDTDLPFKLLALPYADHPDYQAEWAPGTP